MIRKMSFWFTLFLVAIVLAFVVQALTYAPDPRFFPLLIGIPTLIAGVWILLAEKWPGIIRMFDVSVGSRVKKLAPGIDADDEAPMPEVLKLTPIQVRNRLLVISAWMAGYFVVVFLAGFLIADFLLPAAYIKVHAKAGWLKSALIAGAVTFVIWVSFDYFMKAAMFQGILFGEMVPLL